MKKPKIYKSGNQIVKKYPSLYCVNGLMCKAIKDKKGVTHFVKV